MTTDLNIEWDYDKLIDAIDLMQTAFHKYNYAAARYTKEGREHPAALKQEKADALEHAIRFIYFNMREIEICDWNGD